MTPETLTLDDLLMPANGRGVLVGMTGSGKTTLARYILKPFRNVVAYDVKGTLFWRGYTRLESLKEIVSSKPDGDGNQRLIYAPNHAELYSETYRDLFFQWCYERMHTFLYIDEVSGVTDRLEISPYYHAILTRGRERGNGLLSATQRPVLIPSVIMSESENWYVFRLGMEADRKKVEACIGLSEEKIAALPKRRFYFVKADEALYSPPLTLKLAA
jgi:hypothetical protein